MYSQEEGRPEEGRDSVDRSRSVVVEAVVEVPSQVTDRFEGEEVDADEPDETLCVNV